MHAKVFFVSLRKTNILSKGKKLLVAEMNNDEDYNHIVKMIRQIKGKTKILKGELLDDFNFGMLVGESHLKNNGTHKKS